MKSAFFSNINYPEEHIQVINIEHCQRKSQKNVKINIKDFFIYSHPIF